MNLAWEETLSSKLEDMVSNVFERPTVLITLFDIHCYFHLENKDGISTCISLLGMFPLLLSLNLLTVV